MDGNGRWAKGLGKKRVFGHRQGAVSVRKTIEAAMETGVSCLTLYAFSSENWNRPKLEVSMLMDLLMEFILKEVDSINENGIKLSVIGERSRLPDKVNKKLDQAILSTKDNDKMTLTIALSYGSRDELINVVKVVSEKVLKKELNITEIDEKIINNHLYTFNLPNVDLLIRTSGEKRISNFLLWQIAYAELYFTDTLWPDFGKEDFFKAIEEYKNRERRFGKTSEQI
ncbi:MAG: isoprenyl transferase [Flavobacteriaceae bacterium]|nr:isoprenyl transferase [Flavobacteriaceae bacterium]